MNKTTFESVATYLCLVGFSSQSLDSDIQCGADGRWSTTSFVCKPINCGDPPDISFTEKEYNQTIYNSYVTYTCTKDYKFKSGQDFKVCLADGRWSSDNPLQCEMRKCGHPAGINNGHFVPILVEYTVDSSINYHCEPLFYLVGNKTSYCKTDSLWSTLPKCLPIVCPTFPQSSSEVLSIQVRQQLNKTSKYDMVEVI